MHVPLHCLTADLILSQTEGHCFGTRSLLLHAFNHLFGGVIEPTWYASLDSIRYDSILSFIMWWKKDVQQSALPGSSAKGEDQKFLKTNQRSSGLSWELVFLMSCIVRQKNRPALNDQELLLMVKEHSEHLTATVSDWKIVRSAWIFCDGS